jgi:GNAT superfamily N-acetyltransferase
LRKPLHDAKNRHEHRSFYDPRSQSRRLSALLELYQHLAEGDERPSLDSAEEVFEWLKAYKGSAIIVGQVAGALVASCTLIVVPNLTRGGRPYGLIENVVTHRNFRNRGFGKQVLLQAVDLA